MKLLTGSKVTPSGTILDETSRPLHRADEKVARWKRYFEEVLNWQNTLEERAMAGLEDHSHIDTPEVTREEVERVVKKLQNGKAAGDDRIIEEIWKTRQVPQKWQN